MFHEKHSGFLKKIPHTGSPIYVPRVGFQCPARHDDGIRAYQLTYRNQQIGVCASKLVKVKNDQNKELHALTDFRVHGIENLWGETTMCGDETRATVFAGNERIAALSRMSSRPEQYSVEDYTGKEFCQIIRKTKWMVDAKAFRLVLSPSHKTREHEFRIAITGTGVREFLSSSHRYTTIWGKGSIPSINAMEMAAVLTINSVFRTVIHPLIFLQCRNLGDGRFSPRTPTGSVDLYVICCFAINCW